MIANRSMPKAGVIPVLVRPDVIEACEWLCNAFGFTLRWWAGDHRVQLNVADGCVVVTKGDAAVSGVSIMVRVADVDAHCVAAMGQGARILSAPRDYPYGERQYTAADPDGGTWTFSQSIADIDPASWGAEIGEL